MVLDVNIGDILYGSIFNNYLVGDFEVVFMTKQNKRIVRLRKVGTEFVKLINLDDTNHELVLK